MNATMSKKTIGKDNDEAATVREFAEFIAPLYEQMGWEWHKQGIPNAFMIAQTTRALIENCKMILDREPQRKCIDCSTGGIFVQMYRQAIGFRIHLAFMPASFTIDKL